MPKSSVRLIQYGYVAEKKDGLYITAAGGSMWIPLDGIGITDPMFAADMDMKIKKVQRGERLTKKFTRMFLTA